MMFSESFLVPTDWPFEDRRLLRLLLRLLPGLSSATYKGSHSVRYRLKCSKNDPSSLSHDVMLCDGVSVKKSSLFI